MVCYRHSDRETYVTCQRCGRSICGECQVDSAVGFLCPECAGGTQRKITKQRNSLLRGATPITTTLIAINVLVWLLEVSQPIGLLEQLVLMPKLVAVEPWTLITSGFTHDWTSPLHLLVNMYSLYIFGQAVEPLLGKSRFIALYMISLFAGAVGVLWLAVPNGITVGASGAIFGLMGAYLIFLKALGQPSGQMLGLIAINLAFGFFASGISWEGHVGGLIGGIVVASIYARTRKPSEQGLQIFGLVAIVAILVVAAVVRITQLG